jgi:hypothetical protein
MRFVSSWSWLLLATLPWSSAANELDGSVRSLPAPRTSPVGLWKTVDDTTGKVTSTVVIWEEKGKLYGKIQDLLDPDPKDRTLGACVARVR